MMDYSKKSIIAFGLRAEYFRVIALSNDKCDKIFNYVSIEVKGKIALLDCCGSFTLIMKNGRVMAFIFLRSGNHI